MRQRDIGRTGRQRQRDLLAGRRDGAGPFAGRGPVVVEYVAVVDEAIYALRPDIGHLEGPRLFEHHRVGDSDLGLQPAGRCHMQALFVTRLIGQRRRIEVEVRRVLHRDGVNHQGLPLPAADGVAPDGRPDVFRGRMAPTVGVDIADLAILAGDDRFTWRDDEFERRRRVHHHWKAPAGLFRSRADGQTKHALEP